MPDRNGSCSEVKFFAWFQIIFNHLNLQPIFKQLMYVDTFTFQSLSLSSLYFLFFNCTFQVILCNKNCQVTLHLKFNELFITCFSTKGLFPLGLRVDSQASPLTKCCELDVNSASYLWRVVDSESTIYAV